VPGSNFNVNVNHNKFPVFVVAFLMLLRITSIMNIKEEQNKTKPIPSADLNRLNISEERK
jgi:uncharacterized membrane protein YadS